MYLIVLLLAALTLVACGTAAPTSTVTDPAAPAADPAPVAETQIDPASGLPLPAPTAVPLPWPGKTVFDAETFDGNGDGVSDLELRWYEGLTSDPRFAIVAPALPVAGVVSQLDSPVIPVADIVAVGGVILYYVYIVNDGPQIVSEVVVDNVTALREWLKWRATQPGADVAQHPAGMAAALDDPTLGFGPGAFEVTLDDGTVAVMPDLDWIINMSNNHGDAVVPVPGRNGTPAVEVGNQSLQVMQAFALEASRNGGNLTPKGDGRSNGSVILYIAKDPTRPGEAYVPAKLIVNNQVWFVVFLAPLQNAGANLCPGGTLCFGDGTFIDPKALKWLCSWIAGDRIPGQNGHGIQGRPVTVGRGYDQWWARVQTRYQPLIKLTQVSFPIPPILADFIK